MSPLLSPLALALLSASLGAAPAANAPNKQTPRDTVLLLGIETGETFSTWLVDASGLTKVGEGLVIPTDEGWKVLVGQRVVKPPAAPEPTAEELAEREGMRPSCDAMPPFDEERVDATSLEFKDRAWSCKPEKPSTETIEHHRTHQGRCNCGAGRQLTLRQRPSFVSGKNVSVVESRLVEGEYCVCDLCEYTASSKYGVETMELGVATCGLNGASPLTEDVLRGGPATFENQMGLGRHEGQWKAFRLGRKVPWADEEWGEPQRRWFPTVLPASETGQTPLGRPWAEHAKEYLRLTDLIVSPKDTFRVLLFPDAIQLQVGEAQPQTVPLENPRVVMTQWALGKHAARWRTEVPRQLTSPAAP
ncbi:hypothetical protein P2318_03310 [Myxococcaceae bacterium GXIMD 01537]